MFSRVVAVRTKEGKARQLAKTIQEKILPILESQTGFVDEVILISDTEPDQILALELLEESGRCRALHTRTISKGQRVDFPLGGERPGVQDVQR